MPAGSVKVTATFKDAPDVITVDEETENGTLSVEPASAAEGETVTVNAEPADGYVVDKITVTDGNGNEIEVSEDGTFIMPSGPVEVTATFRDAPDGITVDKNTENGKVSVEPETAVEGDTVTV